MPGSVAEEIEAKGRKESELSTTLAQIPQGYMRIHVGGGRGIREEKTDILKRKSIERSSRDHHNMTDCCESLRYRPSSLLHLPPLIMTISIVVVLVVLPTYEYNIA